MNDVDKIFKLMGRLNGTGPLYETKHLANHGNEPSLADVQKDFSEVLGFPLRFLGKISQTGSAAPTEGDVVINSIGDLAFTRVSAGLYKATLLAAFKGEVVHKILPFTAAAFVNGQTKRYLTPLTQVTTGAPSEGTALINTVGDIAWTRGSAGKYVGTLATAFTNGIVPKSFPIFNSSHVMIGTAVLFKNDANTVHLWTYGLSDDPSGTPVAVADDLLDATPIDVEVLPAAAAGWIEVVKNDDDSVYVKTYNSAGVLTDAMLSDTLIDIESVYSSD